MDYQIIDKETISYIHKKISELHKTVMQDFKDTKEMDRMLDNYDVCKILGITLRTLQHYRNKDMIAFTVFQGKCLYRQEDVYGFIEKNKAEAKKRYENY